MTPRCARCGWILTSEARLREVVGYCACKTPDPAVPLSKLAPLVASLLESTWTVVDGDDDEPCRWCAVCSGPNDGHDPDCEVAALIALVAEYEPKEDAK